MERKKTVLVKRRKEQVRGLCVDEEHEIKDACLESTEAIGLIGGRPIDATTHEKIKNGK